MSNINPNQYMTYNQNNYQPYQATQYFPQPQGSIYMIGNSMDVANVPVGAGLSAAICLREGIMYLKTIQNGSPMLLAYKLAPMENSSNITTQEQSNNIPQQQESIEQKILGLLEGFDKRLKELENISKPKGGTDKWQL